MTPTAEWYEADADDSDRSITDDVTDNTHETARAATQTGETDARVHGDVDLLRKRTAARDRVAAENERLRAEVEQWRTVYERANDWSWEQASRAEAAGAKLRDVEAERDALRAGMEALADEWERDHLAVKSPIRWRGPAAQTLRAVLARSQAPQAPAEPEASVVPSRGEQRRLDNLPCPTCGGDRLRPNFTGERGRCHAPSVRPATTDGEG